MIKESVIVSFPSDITLAIVWLPDSPVKKTMKNQSYSSETSLFWTRASFSLP